MEKRIKNPQKFADEYIRWYCINEYSQKKGTFMP